MVSAIKQFIVNRNLCDTNHRILIAVSGGIDSVVMLDLLLKVGYDISIAHCNFKLRGDESDEDEDFVVELAKKYQVELFAKSFDTGEYARKNKCSIQEAARELRYEWFDELVKINKIDRIAVGQHLDDQVETFFINLFRGSGVKGLKSIPVKRGKVIRPLMFTSRKEIEDYAKENRLEFREDSSNKSDKYLRNKIRRKLLPVLADVNPSYQDDITKSLKYLEEDNQIMQSLLSDWRKEIIGKDSGNLKIKISTIKDLSHLKTFYLLKDFGFSRDVSDQITESLQSQKSGKLFYSTTHQLLIDREFLILKEIGVPEGYDTYLIEDNQKQINEPVHLVVNKQAVDHTFKINEDASFAYFDVDKITFPLTIRRWKTGDRFMPFGMTGSKLVSDYLIDAKINRFDKENVWVMLSGGEIIWLIGYRSSDCYKINEDTKTILEINFVK